MNHFTTRWDKQRWRGLGALLLLMLCTQTAFAQRLLEYRNQIPVIDYAQPSDDSVTALFAEIEAGGLSIDYQGNRGYLDSLLEAFGISPSSQVLVFSKSALKGRLISPETPRAIYFNDDVYVAFVAGTPELEIAAMDPLLGPVFYVVPLAPEEDITLTRLESRCLNCHVKNYMEGGGVPMFSFQSTLVDEDGEIYMVRNNEVQTHISTPFNERWGGWYVTGLHGEQTHRGNVMYPGPPNRQRLAMFAEGNLLSAESLFDSSPYPSAYSDIVALLVMQHQIDVQNEITRVNYQVRTQMAEQGELSETELAEKTEPLLQALFMSGEFALTDPVTGVSGFTEHFQSLGPFDGYGRSLRDFDLQSRVFKYPLSYQIYSKAFDALPETVLDYLGRRSLEILSGEDQSAAYAHLSESDRQTIHTIVQETKPGFLSRL